MSLGPLRIKYQDGIRYTRIPLREGAGEARGEVRPWPRSAYN